MNNKRINNNQLLLVFLQFFSCIAGTARLNATVAASSYQQGDPVAPTGSEDSGLGDFCNTIAEVFAKSIIRFCSCFPFDAAVDQGISDSFMPYSRNFGARWASVATATLIYCMHGPSIKWTYIPIACIGLLAMALCDRCKEVRRLCLAPILTLCGIAFMVARLKYPGTNLHYFYLAFYIFGAFGLLTTMLLAFCFDDIEKMEKVRAGKGEKGGEDMYKESSIKRGGNCRTLHRAGCIFPTTLSNSKRRIIAFYIKTLKLDEPAAADYFSRGRCSHLFLSTLFLVTLVIKTLISLNYFDILKFTEPLIVKHCIWWIYAALLGLFFADIIVTRIRAVKFFKVEREKTIEKWDASQRRTTQDGPDHLDPDGQTQAQASAINPVATADPVQDPERKRTPPQPTPQPTPQPNRASTFSSDTYQPTDLGHFVGPDYRGTESSEGVSENSSEGGQDPLPITAASDVTDIENAPTHSTAQQRNRVIHAATLDPYNAYQVFGLPHRPATTPAPVAVQAPTSITPPSGPGVGMPTGIVVASVPDETAIVPEAAPDGATVTAELAPDETTIAPDSEEENGPSVPTRTVQLGDMRKITIVIGDQTIQLRLPEESESFYCYLKNIRRSTGDVDNRANGVFDFLDQHGLHFPTLSDADVEKVNADPEASQVEIFSVDNDLLGRPVRTVLGLQNGQSINDVIAESQRHRECLRLIRRNG